jgi:outer membrane protein OmpA-like peptidoglycan-associated protein
MRKIGSFLVTLALSTFVFSLSAQENEGSKAELENQSGDNWFFSLGGGLSLLQAEQDHDLAIKHRIRYAGEFSVGKWFNPYFGTRLQLSAGPQRGFNYYRPHGGVQDDRYIGADRHRWKFPWGGAKMHDPSGNIYFYGDNETPPSGYNIHWLSSQVAEQTPDWKLYESKKDDAIRLPSNRFAYWQEFVYEAATFDFLVNFSNLYYGNYDENRKFDVIPYVGIGWMHAVKSATNPTHDGATFKVGGRLNYNLNTKWSLFLEPQAYFSSEDLDGYKGDRGFDVVSNAFIGVQYTINKSYTDRTQQAFDEIDRLNRKVNENRYLIDNHQDILERQQSLLDKLEKCCEEKPVVVTTPIVAKSWAPEYVRFVIDSYVIEEKEYYKIKDAADYLKTSPESKLLLVGYADRKTANPKYNLQLSRKRVDAVAAEFKRLGIGPERLIIEWKGDKEQPFAQNDWNRVVVLVERK